jgi:hypothetical protein
MTIANLRRRLAKLEEVDQPPVTLEECLERIRNNTPDDPEFERRLRASPIGWALADLAKRPPDATTPSTT